MINVQICCGCGQKYEDFVEAAKHSDTQGHKMMIQGTVTPNNYGRKEETK